MNTSEMTGDMISLGTRCATVLPLAGEAEIVGALTADMVVAEMVIKSLWVSKGQLTVLPLTIVGGLRGIWFWGGTRRGDRRRGGKGRRHVQVGNKWQTEVLGVHHVLKESFLPRTVRAKTTLARLLCRQALKPSPSRHGACRPFVILLALSTFCLLGIIHTQHFDPLPVIEITLSIRKWSLQ